MTKGTDNHDLIVVGCGAAGTLAAVSYIETTKEQGRAPRVAVLESAPQDQRGVPRVGPPLGFVLARITSLDPLFVGKVQEASKGLSDIEYCRVLEREVPEHASISRNTWRETPALWSSGSDGRRA